MNRVYLVNLSFGLAGIERRFANLWRVLRKRGNVSPMLVVPSTLAHTLREARLLPDDPGAVVVVPETAVCAALGRMSLPALLHTPRSIIRSRAIAMGFSKVWRDVAADPGAVVHIGMPCSALRPPDVPTVYECVDSALQSFGSRHFRRAASRRCIVHCQTDRIRTMLDASFASRAPRWQTVTNPTYFAYYADTAGGRPRDPRAVAFVGRLHPIKNPLLLIEALALARQRGCPCRLTMLGEGPLRPQIEALVRRYGLQDEVSITFDARGPELLLQAAIYVSLQIGDNYGSQALLEAMGAGCAVVASDVGETGRIVTDEVGVRVPLTVDGVASAIVALVGDPDRTRRLGAAAARIARTQYSADTYAAFLESLYERAAQFHRAADSSQARAAAVRALR